MRRPNPRIVDSPKQKPGKGPNGRPFCCWCGKEVLGRRRRWCGEECIADYRIRSDLRHARRLVFKRDKGVCAECKIDTGALKVEARHDSTVRKSLHALGFTKKHLWEMDHIVPVVEGGGGCGLNNLRTLCIPCHKTATAALRTRLANRKKSQPSHP